MTCRVGGSSAFFGWELSLSMLTQALEAAIELAPRGLAFISPGSETTWGELADIWQAWRQRLAADFTPPPSANSYSCAASNAATGPRVDGAMSRSVGLSFSASPAAWALAASLEELGWNVVLLDPLLSPAACHDFAVRWQLSGWWRPDLDAAAWSPVATPPARTAADAAQAAVVPPESAVGRGASHAPVSSVVAADEPGVIILTSGTTGEPKLVRHTWRSIFGPATPRRDGQHSRPRWLLTYRPQLYAGLQVMAQAIRGADTLVVPDGMESPDELAQFASDAQVSHVSATPAFWRKLTTFVAAEHLSRVPLRQITLGGEAVDQCLLDRLHALFPAARITHIYATTELGRCFSVADGRAGFPAEWLQEPPAGVELRIEQGELCVRSAHRAMVAKTPVSQVESSGGVDADALSDWVATGDLVELQGDRYIFTGRISELINVGGFKVAPLRVENIIRSVSGVRDARVYGVVSSLTGQLVACDVVAQEGFDLAPLQVSILSSCRERLVRQEVPRFLNFVAQIDTTTSGKVRRGGLNGELMS